MIFGWDSKRSEIMLGSKGLKVSTEKEEVDFCGFERGKSPYRIVNGGEAAMAATLYGYLEDTLSGSRREGLNA